MLGKERKEEEEEDKLPPTITKADQVRLCVPQKALIVYVHLANSYM